MFLALAILLIVWFVEMPLWVSIFCTVLAGITILIKFFTSIFDYLNKFINHDSEDNENDI